MTIENAGADGANQEGPVSEAIRDLEKAEVHLEHARADEVAAEHEVAEALEKLKDEEDHEHVKVHVVHVNDVEKVSFKERLSATLAAVWDKAYVELKIPRKPKDVFQTGGEHPKSLMSHLNLTLEKAKEEHVIKDYHFGIVSETGGA
jgi:hypothetical protein